MPIVTASTKGQIVIPAELRRRHGIEPGTRIRVEETEDGILLRPTEKNPIDAAYGMLAHLGPLTAELEAERKWECEQEEAELPPPRKRDDGV